MKTQIRYSAFETNSSSMHTITYVKHNKHNEQQYNQELEQLKGDLIFDANEYHKIIDDIDNFKREYISPKEKIYLLLALFASYNDLEYEYYKNHGIDNSSYQDILTKLSERKAIREVIGEDEYWKTYNKPILWLLEVLQEFGINIKIGYLNCIDSLNDDMMCNTFAKSLPIKHSDDIFTNEELCKSICREIITNRKIQLADSGYNC